MTVDILVTSRPWMGVDQENYDFTILAGDSINGSFNIYNWGKAALSYNASVLIVSGPGGSREEFLNTTNTFSGAARSRGNVYSVSTTTPLSKQEFYLGLSAPTDVEFFVYEGNTVTGSFTKIYTSGTQVLGPGTGFFSSPSFSLTMVAGKFYYIGAAWNQSATYYNDNGTFGVPEPTSFGAIQYGVTLGTGYPAATPATLSSSIVVYPQAITTGAGVQVSMLTPLAGSIPDSSSTVQQWHALSTGASPLGEYHFNLRTTGSDPLVPVHNLDLQINVVSSFVGVDDAGRFIPTAFALRPNEPNPFNPMTKVSFDLPRESRVSIAVFDAAGRKVTTLVDRSMPAGRHEVPWAGLDGGGRSVASGVYLLRMEAGSFSDRVKMLLVK